STSLVVSTHALYVLALHDSLPILHGDEVAQRRRPVVAVVDLRRHAVDLEKLPDVLEGTVAGPIRHGQLEIGVLALGAVEPVVLRSEEHTSELQSPDHLV